MSHIEESKVCYKCKRSVVTCYCHVLKPVKTLHHYIILQHDSEVGHPLGTALMAHRNLQNSTLLTGESFDNNEVFKSLIAQRNTYLLYPYEDAVDILELKENLQQEAVNFIILDGTWKKARKIYHLSETLKQLPLIKITPKALSKYLIRKQPKSNGLSTIETLFEVMQQIADGDSKDFLVPFNFVIEKQIKMMGQNVFDKYYS